MHFSCWLFAECRPCSVKESLEMFCSSDFVARGFISSVYNDAQLERTLLKVRATRVIRQASSVFQPVSRRSASLPKRKRRSPLTPKRLIPIPSKWKGMDGVEEDLTDSEMDNSLLDDEHTGTLHVPLTCQVKHGSGEFVFMGRKRLGDAVLWCAPRLEEWQQWVHQAQTDGSAQCRLEAWKWLSHSPPFRCDIWFHPSDVMCHFFHVRLSSCVFYLSNRRLPIKTFWLAGRRADAPPRFYVNFIICKWRKQIMCTFFYKTERLNCLFFFFYVCRVCERRTPIRKRKTKENSNF